MSSIGRNARLTFGLERGMDPLSVKGRGKVYHEIFSTIDDLAPGEERLKAWWCVINFGPDWSIRSGLLDTQAGNLILTTTRLLHEPVLASEDLVVPIPHGVGKAEQFALNSLARRFNKGKGPKQVNLADIRSLVRDEAEASANRLRLVAKDGNSIRLSIEDRGWHPVWDRRRMEIHGAVATQAIADINSRVSSTSS